MSRIAWKSLRVRWVSLTGAFVALSLGVALMTVMLLGLAATARLPWGEAAIGLNSAFGTAGGVSTFVAGFVISSTFSYVVAQRQRELGLLRLTGASRGQVRRMVLFEALALGVVASAAGCALGAAGAPRLGRELVRVGTAPEGFTIGTGGFGAEGWPLYAAFWTGLLVAVAGVAAAAHRAGRLGPLDALREADVNSRVMTGGRWLCGLGLLLTALVLTGTALVDAPGTLLRRKNYTVQPMVLISACGLLTPVLARPLLHGLGALPARLTSYAGRLVRANALGGVRRTGAVAAPVLVSVALAGSLLGGMNTVAAGRAAEARSQSAPDHVVTPQRGTRVEELVRELRTVPGVVVAPSAPTVVAVVESDGVQVRTEARAVDPATYGKVSRLPLVAGSLAGLDDDSVILPEEWEQHTVGAPVELVLADGSRRTLRVAGVLRDGTGNNGLYLTARNAPGARVDRIEVSGSGPGTERQLAVVAERYRAELVTGERWLATAYPVAPNRVSWLRAVLVLGLALVYTAIGLANTLVLATADRKRELAQLRLAGATRTQVIRVVTAESLLAVAAGAVLGALVTGVNLGGMQVALRVLGVDPPLVVPWLAVGGVAGVCAVIAVPCTVVAAAWALRERAVTVVG
ncbi:FtsX-like permease family protein [Kitasatospora gansuensis]